MLEWLITIGAAELGKAMFEKILKLSQAATEDYVKDFFKGCLKEGMAAAKPEVAKKAVAEALKAFLLLVTDELEDQELSKAEIRDRYEPALVQFIQNDAVKTILSQAFEKDCKVIETKALSTIWQQSTVRGKPFPAMSSEFSWKRVSNEYLKKVRRLIRETLELRSLLETELLEDIAHNTAQISPGFDVAKYRDSLQCSYGHLKLYAIDSTDRVDAIKLWQMFIEQTVREALPPTRYELPLDLKSQLQATGQLETDLSAEALDQYRSEYFQQPARKVLAVIQESQSVVQISDSSKKWERSHSQRAVILGDPGAGKSTLLQYLALAWAESQPSAVSATSDDSNRLPLLIELREYALASVDGFLEFLHRGRGVDWQFDQQQLHQHLQSQPTLVMFDGLDEVFDRPTQATIIDDIIRFAQQYPQAQILVTSRMIGYNPDRLQHAHFRHFTIQPLDRDEITEFIDRWYTLALGSDADKPRLVTRLKEAIAHSKAIQNLADNPLLLTMMAILNRRQELPRDRADLYDQASRVLLYHWDVDHKRLYLPMDAIGRREKQEMLRAIAYEMQTSDEGLKGNLISADRLTRILTDYLRDQCFSEPREKANGLIEQLRHRNWILCDRGADTYGFVHRTFLEYFCAMEIVHRFEKQRALTFEQLRDDVFGLHWQDETWHEVLRLICGMIDPKFAGELIEFLTTRELDQSKFLDEEWLRYTREKRLLPGGVIHLLLAADCFFNVSDSAKILHVKDLLLLHLKVLIEQPTIRLTRTTASEILNRIAQYFRSAETMSWLQQRVGKDESSVVQAAAVVAIAKYCYDDSEILPWLKENVRSSEDWGLRKGSLEAIVERYHNYTGTLAILRHCAQEDDDWSVRSTAIDAITRYFSNEPGMFELLCHVVQHDPFVRDVNWQDSPRQFALQALLGHYPTHPNTVELLRDRAANDPDAQMQQWAQQQLAIRELRAP
jgi:predicted NACHT family NTPase